MRSDCASSGGNDFPSKPISPKEKLFFTIKLVKSNGIAHSYFTT